MQKYYKTNIDSETGKKFVNLIAKMEECRDAIEKLEQKYKFTKRWESDWAEVLSGGLSAVNFKNPPNPKVWKKAHGGYLPNSTKSGLVIKRKFEALPRVNKEELNNIVGYKSVFNQIGYAFKDPNHIGFYILAEWVVNIPSDCVEITCTEYQELNKESPLLSRFCQF